MESKRAKYILGFSLLAIWSLLFLRVRERVNKQNDFAIVSQGPEVNLHKVFNENYDLLLTYTDPFRIGKVTKKKPTGRPISKTVKPNKKIEKKEDKRNRKKAPPKKLPEYIYKGYIVVRGGKRVALVNDGARNYNLEVGGKIQETTLTRIFEDSIQMRVGEEIISFPKFNK